MFRWLVLPALLLATTPAMALRCGSRIVQEGDRDGSVRERCGMPYYVDRYYSVDVHGADGPYERQIENQYDAWYYNFGPRKLLVRLVFHNGRLQSEETLGYGVNQIGDSCHLDTAPSGTSAGEIVAWCGEPASRRNLREAEIRRDGRGNERYRPIRLEEWTYDFGDDRFLRILTFRNGNLQGVSVERR
ncbi:DUF2845 domain-containing protein [Tahibacter amnicola]|uniref:DUF2845 domain-containing protein n=1 Tax=Tahibacter amnicola TaxID=2976241 RepID=A0ABY6BE55_9GAMM|nr:DUF2845 domain-containing protein [Tahibacter amnicola]UXI68314.1 DUF2845 domain-containing protein [Tahibacter amnicola]